MSAVEIVPPARQFDYGTLAPEVARRAADAATRIRSAMSGAIAEVGRELLDVQEALGRGAFGRWMEAEFGMSERTARNYMAAAKLGERFPATVAGLPPKAVYALASPALPDDVRTQIAGRIEAGERVAPAEIEEAVYTARQQAKEERGKTPEQVAAARRKEAARQARVVRNREKWRQEIEAKEAQRQAVRSQIAAILRTRLADDRDVMAKLLDRGGWPELARMLRE